MTEDPILKKLDAIIDRRVDDSLPAARKHLKIDMRELLAEAQIEEHRRAAICDNGNPCNRATAILERFGLAPKEGTT